MFAKGVPSRVPCKEAEHREANRGGQREQVKPLASTGRVLGHCRPSTPTAYPKKGGPASLQGSQGQCQAVRGGPPVRVCSELQELGVQERLSRGDQPVGQVGRLTSVGFPAPPSS